jgi:aspartate/methionine/tyrosine aminotransferase
MDIAELQRAVDEAKKHCIPRAIVIINPGNPTGMLPTDLFLNFFATVFKLCYISTISEQLGMLY